MAELDIHVGGTREDMAARFAQAWRRAEQGETHAERHLSFDSFETLARVLSPRRLELLRALHARPAASIAALARQLGRDYKRVHEDVEALTAAGLIERPEAGALRAPYAEIRTIIAL
ncbi:MAG TPA: helix-turn-helix domain-containing protein [Phenylobacterium sp.]|nr:helix-turn-helix domain-containing protein [Phenylobacterium sp.]